MSSAVLEAFVVHEQFYPAVIYLSTDKMCLAVMYNFASGIPAPGWSPESPIPLN